MTITDTTPAKPSGFLASIMALVPKSLVLTGNPAIDGTIFRGIVAVASIGGTWLYTHLKLTDPDYAKYLTGAIIAALVTAVTFVWGWINSKANQAKAMNAAVAMKAAGASIPVPSQVVPGAVTDRPITPATAQEIVKQFGNVHVAVDAETALTNQLNTFANGGAVGGGTK